MGLHAPCHTSDGARDGVWRPPECRRSESISCDSPHLGSPGCQVRRTPDTIRGTCWLEAIAASVDITPSRLLPAACNGAFNTPSQAVALPFEANILALREHGHTLVIISLDWFFASPGLRACILDRCAGRLDDASLFVAASHAHTSPATDATKVGFSAVDEAYVTAVENGVANRVDDLLR